MRAKSKGRHVDAGVLSMSPVPHTHEIINRETPLSKSPRGMLVVVNLPGSDPTFPCGFACGASGIRGGTSLGANGRKGYNY